MGIFGFFNKEKKETLDKGLEKTKTSVFDKLARAVAGKSKVDDDVLDILEEVLITSDVGVETTLKIIERIEDRVARVQVQLHLSGDQLQDFVDVRHQLLRRRRAPGIISGGLNAAGQGFVRVGVEAAHVVALPTV